MAIAFSPVNIESRRKLDIRAGDTVRVWQKIEEKGKTRLQAFEGLVVARKHGREPGGTFTVRKIASGVGVEKIFPLYSPVIDKVEVVRRAKVRRAKLYYIREKTAKQIRKKMKGLAEFVPVSYQEAAPADAEAEEEEGKEDEAVVEGAPADGQKAEGAEEKTEAAGEGKPEKING